MAASRSTRAFKSAATRRSNDAQTESNISPGLHTLFNRVKRGLKGKNADQRSEAFHEYAESHPKEVMAALQSHADAKLAALLRQPRTKQPAYMRRMARSPRQSSSSGSMGGGTDSGIGAMSVPF